MLRRVVRTLRVLLLVIGLGLLALWPVSGLFQITLESPWPFEVTVLASRGGEVGMYFYAEVPAADRPRPGFALYPLDEYSWMPGRPGIARADLGPLKVTEVTSPLWLIAAVCLGWPVTSLVVRRRRRGRGFEVEGKVAGDPAADPPDAAGGRA